MPTFRCRTCRSARFRRRGIDEPWRIGVAIGDQVLDLRRARGAVPLAARHRTMAAPAGRRRPVEPDGRHRRRAAHRARRPVVGIARRQRPGPVPRVVPGAAGRGGVRAAVPHRRLHRLLHRHPPCHHGGPAVPARQPAAAQLQVGADRLPRPRIVDHGQRPHLQPAARPNPAARRVHAGVRALPPARLRARTRHLRRRRQPRRHAADDGSRPRTTGSAWCC